MHTNVCRCSYVDLDAGKSKISYYKSIEPAYLEQVQIQEQDTIGTDSRYHPTSVCDRFNLNTSDSEISNLIGPLYNLQT